MRDGCPRVDILILLALHSQQPPIVFYDQRAPSGAPRAQCGTLKGNSIRFGQTEHALRDVAENEVRADRGDARGQNLPLAAPT